MINRPRDLPLVAFTVGVYKALLVAYPKNFKQEYGRHMLQVFRDCSLDTFHRNGTRGILNLWSSTLLDFVQSVISEHLRKETQMKKEMKPEDIRMAGVALMLGAVAFAIGLPLGYMGSYENDFWKISLILLTFFAMPLLAVGMMALQNRYGDKAGGFGKNILLTGVLLGSLSSITGFFAIAGELSWLIAYAGPGILLAGLALFGADAMNRKPLPRWNFLPLLAGFWYPTGLSIYILSVFTGNWFQVSGTNALVLAILFSITHGIALAALGYLLRADAPQELVGPA